MTRVRLARWASQIQPPRNPRLPLQRCPFSSTPGDAQRAPVRQVHQRQHTRLRWQSQGKSVVGDRRHASTAAAESLDEAVEDSFDESSLPPLQPLNAPSWRRATSSAKLSALHARLSLPAKLPLQTLARCLVDQSVDSRPGYNNAPLALMGQELLGYYTAEWLICHYPRLPMSILFAAQYAYVGDKTLSTLRSEWGVEAVAAPGEEVDPGLLQLERVTPGNSMAENGQMKLKDMAGVARLSGTGRPNEEKGRHWRRGISSRVVYDDQFGDLQSDLPNGSTDPNAPIAVHADSVSQDERSATASMTRPTGPQASTLDAASASFIRALMGALYLHAGLAASKQFHEHHILSRHLPLHTLFNFTHPTRDLSRLCLREGFEPPVARLLSETGRLSRSPVFVVGVYSGEDKLGEGAGSSLDEARVRAAAAALRSWYLYSPPEEDIMVPSGQEGGSGKGRWKSQMIDIGEVVT